LYTQGIFIVVVMQVSVRPIKKFMGSTKSIFFAQQQTAAELGKLGTNHWCHGYLWSIKSQYHIY